MDLDFDRDGNKDGCVSEQDLGIDLDGNGLLTTAGCNTDGSNTIPDLTADPLPTTVDALLYNPNARTTAGADTLTSLQEKNMPFGVMVRTGFFEVKDEADPIVKAVTIKSASCAGSMREDAEGTQTFTVEVELARKRPEVSALRFEIEDETEANREDSECDDCVGIRDIDYEADMGELRIPAQTLKGTTTLTVTSRDNDEEDGDKVFLLKAFLADERPPPPYSRSLMTKRLVLA